VGGAVAFGGIYLLRNGVAKVVSANSPFGLDIHITTTEGLVSGAVVLVVGGLVGAMGSALAVRRFLSV